MTRADAKWMLGLWVILLGAGVVIPSSLFGGDPAPVPAEKPSNAPVRHNNPPSRPNAMVRTAATTNALVGAGTAQSVSELTALMNSPERFTAWSAFVGLQDIQPRDQWSALYNRALTNSHHLVRSFAASQIRILGSDGSNCVPALVDSLADEHANVREAAMGTLTHFVPDSGTVAMLVADRLETAKAERRTYFIQRLGRMSALPKSVLNKVVKYADDPDEKVRIAVSQFRYYHPEAPR